MTIQEQVEIVKKKVASVMDKHRVFWREYKQQVVRLQHIVVGTLSTVGQTDTAIKLNSTVVSLLAGIDSAADQTLAVAKDARSVTVASASCSALKLNATLIQATDKVTSVTKQFDDFFQLVDDKFQALAKKLPVGLVEQASQAVAQLKKRGLETSANLLRVYNKAAQKQIQVINRLQDMCVAE
ncbi:ARF, partial [Symbiodinium pilosum]